MYKKFKIFRLNIFVFIIYLVAISCIFSYAVIPINNCIKSKSILKNSSFIESGYRGSFLDKNSYYINFYGIFVYPNVVYGSKSLDTTVFMQKDGIKYENIYLTQYNGKEIEHSRLKENECSISKNILRKYKLNINDKIVIRSNMKNYEFIIKYIFDEFYGLDEINIYNYESLIVLGENKTMIEDSYSYQIYCFSDKSEFYISDIIFTKFQALKDINKALFLYVFSEILITCFLFAIIEIISIKHTRNNYKILRNNCFSFKRMCFYSFIDNIYKFLPIIFIVQIIVMLFGLIFSMSFWINIIILFGIYLLNVGVWFIKDLFIIRSIIK